MLNFLKSTPAKFVTALLLLQTISLYSSVRPESVPPPSAPLAALPHNLGQWTFYREDPVDQETQEVLKADDTIFRFYQSPSGREFRSACLLPHTAPNARANRLTRPRIASLAADGRNSAQTSIRFSSMRKRRSR